MVSYISDICKTDFCFHYKLDIAYFISCLKLSLMNTKKENMEMFILVARKEGVCFFVLYTKEK